MHIRYFMLFGLLYLTGCDKLSNEITDYPVYCGEGRKGNFCNGTWTPLNRTTYEVLKDRQEVIYWMAGVDVPLRKLSNCVVRDRENWSCKYSDNSGEVKMVGGERKGDDRPDIEYVSKWLWWLMRLGKTNYL